MVAPEEKSGDHKNHQDSSSGDHEQQKKRKLLNLLRTAANDK